MTKIDVGKRENGTGRSTLAGEREEIGVRQRKLMNETEETRLRWRRLSENGVKWGRGVDVSVKTDANQVWRSCVTEKRTKIGIVLCFTGHDW